MTIYQVPALQLEVLDPLLVVDCQCCCPRLFFAAGLNSLTEQWRGAALLESRDDTTFSAVQAIPGDAILGFTEDTLANAGYVGEFDETNSVIVVVTGGTLASSTEAKVREGENWFVVGDEVLGAVTVTLLQTGVYELSDLLRGRRETEGEQGGHATGERVVHLDMRRLVERRFDLADVGDTVYWRAIAAGGTSADGLSVSATIPAPSVDSITASTTQTQGQQPLSAAPIQRVTTCANANDVVTLPAALAGREIEIANDGAQTLQVFPKSGDRIDTGAVDASTTLAAAKRATFRCVDGTRWLKLLGS